MTLASHDAAIKPVAWAVKHLKMRAKSRDQETSSEDSSDFDHSSDTDDDLMNGMTLNENVHFDFLN